MRRPYSWSQARVDMQRPQGSTAKGSDFPGHCLHVTWWECEGGDSVLYILTHVCVPAQMYTGMGSWIWIRIDVGITSVLHFII